MTTAVVYVHGLWMVGVEGVLLRRRLSRALGASTPFFHYASVASGVAANAAALASQLLKLDTEVLHLVGHSLGGLVIIKMFEAGGGAGLPPGRVVLLGSPVGGSRAAQRLSFWRLGTRILGKTVAETLLTAHRPRWQEPRELGVIAGDLNVGLGRLVNTHRAPSDGTVYVDETWIAGAKEQLVVHVSHTGLPLSRLVADCTGHFLRAGRFRDPAGC